MKHLRFLLAALLLMVCGIAAHAQKVVVYKHNGTKVEYKASDVDSVAYRPIEKTGLIGYYGWITEEQVYNLTTFDSSLFTNKIETSTLTLTENDLQSGKYFIMCTVSNSKPYATQVQGGTGGLFTLTSGADWEINEKVTIENIDYYVWLRDSPLSVLVTELDISNIK